MPRYIFQSAHGPVTKSLRQTDCWEGLAIAMTPTDLLSYEHRLIEQVLNCLERMMEHTVRDGTMNPATAREIVGFLREYAEGFHLEREERYIFPLISGRECPEGCNVEELLMRKHQESQRHLEIMENAAHSAAKGDRNAIRQFVQAGQSYVELAMTYIEHEEDWLFRQIHRVLNDEQEDELAERLSAEDSQRVADDYASVANRLADQFGVRKTDPLSQMLTRQED